MTRVVGLLLALWLGACSEEPTPTSVHNECFGDKGCEGVGDSHTRCDSFYAACVRDKTTRPYQLIVRVSATTEGTALADAGIQLVAQAATNLGTLTDERDAQVLRVPDAVRIKGSVQSESEGDSWLASELTISPRDSLLPLAPSVVETRFNDRPGDAGAAPLPAMLNPDLRYDVRVQPLLASSGQLPPMEVQNVRPEQPLHISYGAVEKRVGRIGSRGEALRPDRVRLQDKQTGRVVSSSTTVSIQKEDYGSFALYADPEIFQRGDFNLVVGLADFDPWQVTITIDGARFLAGGDIYLPRVPSSGTASGYVEVDDARRTRLGGAELIFVSKYPVDPDEAGGSSPSAGGADWCRWEDPFPISCSGRFRTTSSNQGLYQVDLVPGSYEVFILPSMSDAELLDVVVTEHAETIVVTESGKGGDYLVANRTTPYRGTVTLYKSKTAAPNVTLHALARPTPPLSSWGDVTNYNRNYADLTDQKGQFELLTDVGYYDFVMEAPEGSNFPWRLWLDCPSGPGGGAALAPISLVAPVMVSGVVESESMRVRLPGARVEAFAVVAKPQGEPRTILIGRTVSDDQGAYRLALPQRVGEPANKCEGQAVTDSAR